MAGDPVAVPPVTRTMAWHPNHVGVMVMAPVVNDDDDRIGGWGNGSDE